MNLVHLALNSSLPIRSSDLPLSNGLAWNGLFLRPGMHKGGESSLMIALGFTEYMMFHTNATLLATVRTR